MEILNAGAGIIYYTHINSSIYGLILESPKMAIVTLAGSELIYSGTNTLTCNSTLGGSGSNLSPMLCGGSTIPNQRFLWIEANLNGFDGSTYRAHGGIVAVNLKFSRVHMTSIKNLHPNSVTVGSSALYMRSGSANLITGLNVFQASDGLRLYGSGNNRFYGTNVIQAAKASTCAGGCSLLTLEQNANGNRFTDSRLADATNTTKAIGVNINVSANNVFLKTNISNIVGNNTTTPTTNASEGILISGTSSTNNIFVQLTINSTKDAGIFIYNGANMNVFSHVSTVNNLWNGVMFSGPSVTNNGFNSLALLNSPKPIETQQTGGTGNQFYNLAISSFTAGSGYAVGTAGTGSPFLIFGGYLVKRTNDSCLGDESNLSGSCSAGGVTTTSLADSSWNTAFLGAASSDAMNSADTSGTASYTSLSTNIMHWLNFENTYRSWGLPLPFSPTSRGSCTSGTCQIWDLRANPAGPLYNKSFDGQNPNGTINTDGNTCSALTVSPMATMTAAGKTFLVNAIELEQDKIGNENGLCEAGEDCLWAPNIGSYQGTGGLSIGFCVVGDGMGPGLDGIRIFKHLTN
jgi:hypothetical protein